MSKPTLLYASPFPPKRSGISDYSVILVKALSDKFDITLYTDNYEIEAPSLYSFKVVKHGVDKVDFDSYDHILYNMGNNHLYHQYIYEAALEHPGVIIHHDLSIFHFIYCYFENVLKSLYSSLYSRFGIEAFTAVKNAANDKDALVNLASVMPLYDELLKTDNRFIVHSNYSKNKLLESNLISEDRIAKINLIEQMEDDEVFLEKDALYKKYGIDKDALVIIALGNIVSTKKNKETCRVIKELSKEIDQKICYVMVGNGDLADDYLEDGLIIKTGFTELIEFNSFVKYADIVVNLRYPPMGETSAAVLRSLQMGRPIVTNNGGWFTEIPDDIVEKIELDNVEKNLKKSLKKLIMDKDLRDKLGELGKEYVKNECSKNLIAQKMFDFITSK